MDSFLSDEVVAGLTRARKLAERRSTRLKVRMGNQDFRILKLWDNGFSVDPDHLWLCCDNTQMRLERLKRS